MGTMRKSGGGWAIGLAAFAMTAGVMVAFSEPAEAQMMSDSYNFLKAVRDRDGNKAQPLLDKPGTTIINTRDQATGETPLIIVAKGRDITWTRFLLSKGADPSIRDNTGETALTSAARIGWTEGVELLLARAKVNQPNARGETALILAVQGRNLPLVRLLLANGADAKIADRTTGMSARDYAERDPRAAPIVKLIDETKPVAKPKMSGPGL